MKLTLIKSIFGFYVFVFINILTSLNSFSAKNETISVICGSDSVKLSYPGYENLGVVTWQESLDTLSWGIYLPAYSQYEVNISPKL